MNWLDDPNELALERKERKKSAKAKIRLMRRRKKEEEGSWKEQHDSKWAAYAVLKRRGTWSVFPVRELIGGGQEPDTLMVVMGNRKVGEVRKDSLLFDYVVALQVAQQRNIMESRQFRGLTL